MNYLKCKVAVIGEGNMVPSVVCCLLRAGHQVKSFTSRDPAGEVRRLAEIAGFSCMGNGEWEKNFEGHPELADCAIVVALTPEKMEEKAALLRKIEKVVDQDTLIALNSESIPLDQLQEQMQFPSRLLGLNWTYPAHQTLFAEVIANQQTDTEMTENLMTLVRETWDKDPYLLKGGMGIRSRLMAAMAREAFFLVDQGYVEVADIDRACRNDPGYYLPFAGNCRYMDLMGTFIYGIVMEDLNPELSRASEIPDQFNSLMEVGLDQGRASQGFYSHTVDENEKLELSFLEFSREMRSLMDRYPFPKEDYPEEVGVTAKQEKTNHNHKK